jgi:hypothetical protein
LDDDRCGLPRPLLLLEWLHKLPPVVADETGVERLRFFFMTTTVRAEAG